MGFRSWANETLDRQQCISYDVSSVCRNRSEGQYGRAFYTPEFSFFKIVLLLPRLVPSIV